MAHYLNELIINDMTEAAYLQMRGCRLLSGKKLGKTFKFVFEMPPNYEQLKVDLANSDIATFDAAVRNLKRLVYSAVRD